MRYAVGTWFGLIQANGCIVLDPEIEPTRIHTLWSVLSAGAGFSEVVQALVAGGDIDSLPGFAVLVREKQGYHIAVRGCLAVSATTSEGVVKIQGKRVVTWREEAIVDPLTLSVFVDDCESAQPQWPLKEGIVLVSKIDVCGSGEPMGETGQTTLMPNDDYLNTDSSLDSGDDHDGLTVMGVDDADDHDGMTIMGPVAPTRPPPVPPPTQPMVLSRVCPQCGTANSTRRVQCRACLSKLRGDAVQTTRPPLGKVRLPSGDIIPIDHPIVIGRKPEASRFSNVDIPVLVRVEDPHVSSTHLRVDLEDWSVLITNLGRNGTILRREGETDRRFTDGEQVIAQVGDVYCLSADLNLVILELT